ncbi:hypothetical protein BH23VER1_BH23VER1_06430 [soil metagenome]
MPTPAAWSNGPPTPPTPAALSGTPPRATPPSRAAPTSSSASSSPRSPEKNRQTTLSYLAKGLAAVPPAEPAFAENGVPLALDYFHKQRPHILRETF